MRISAEFPKESDTDRGDCKGRFTRNASGLLIAVALRTLPWSSIAALMPDVAILMANR